MDSIEKSNYKMVPCIKSCKSDKSFSALSCTKKIVDCTIVDGAEEIENTCDCVADYGCQNCESCESDQSFSALNCSKKIVDCTIVDRAEEIEDTCDCVADYGCQNCESEESVNDCSTSEKIVNCIIPEETGKSNDCAVGDDCPGCESKYSRGISQNDSSASEIIVNCSEDEEVENNYDCKDCEGCEIKDSPGDRQKDRPGSEKIVGCQIIDAEEEIEESYDCIVNNDCPACKSRDFQGNSQNDWPISEKMSAKDGLKCVKKMMQEWKNDRAMRGWKFYAQFIGMDGDLASDFYTYQVRWSFPTPAYPEPQVTVSVFFTIEAPRKKHRKCPVDVTYVFEGNQFAHRPKMQFRPKWIYDVLDMKTMMFKSFKF